MLKAHTHENDTKQPRIMFFFEEQQDLTTPVFLSLSLFHFLCFCSSSVRKNMMILYK